MSILQVRQVDDIFFVVSNDGGIRPIQLNEQPIRQFNAGWSPVCVIDVFSPIYILILQNKNGSEASWFLDADLRHLGGSIAQLTGPSRQPLQDRAGILFTSLFDQIVSAPQMKRVDEADDLAVLCEATLHELAALAIPSLLARIAIVDLTNPDVDATFKPAGLRATVLHQTLTGSLPEAYRNRMRDGRLSRPSPFDGNPSEAEIALMLNDRITALRFADSKVSQAFYLIAQDYHDQTTGLFIPASGLYCITSHAPEIHSLLGLLLVHVAQHQQRLWRYLATPPDRKMNVNLGSTYPALHIGHVVWNELSALEELVKTMKVEHLPSVCVLASAQGSEPFGQLDKLFPEFSGKVFRPDIPWTRLAGYIYDNDWFLTRYKTRYVWSGVGRRIQALVTADPVLTSDQAIATRFTAEGRTIVLLGLRVGNRTLSDITDFLMTAIDHLVDRLGRLAIVIDGTNNRIGLDPTTSYGSFGPPGPDEPLIEELRIVFDLRRRCHGIHDVEVISTVGAPMACGLFWAMRSRFFVAPWGAALAKYRWVCNRPGFVVTNRSNIGTATGDLLIYNDPRFVEAPSPMRFVSLDHVLDAPGPVGFYANFQIDPQGLRNGIDELIELTAP